MTILAFTDSEKVQSYFRNIEQKENYDITYFSIKEIKKKLKEIKPHTFVYIDVSRISPEQADSIVRSYCLKKDIYVNVIDTKNKVKDIASLFHAGITDFLSTENMSIPLTEARIIEIENFKNIEKAECTEHGEEHGKLPFDNYIHVNSDWSNIEPGKEYTFLFVHIFFDNYKKIESNYSRSHAVKMVTRMQAYLTNAIKEYYGIIWMWMEKSGLMLFPFDRRGVSPLELLFKLMLNRKIITLENGFRNDLSYRFSVHIGNTIYEPPGNTGEIVSETVNAIFHLGNKYTKPKSVFLTEEAANVLPEKISSLLLEAGSFEGRNIFSMKLPLV